MNAMGRGVLLMSSVLRTTPTISLVSPQRVQTEAIVEGLTSNDGRLHCVEVAG